MNLTDFGRMYHVFLSSKITTKSISSDAYTHQTKRIERVVVPWVDHNDERVR